MGGMMRGLFGAVKEASGAAPQVIQPAPPPVIEDTQVRAEQAADEMRKRRGRAATILSDQSQGQTTGAGSVGTNALLGR